MLIYFIFKIDITAATFGHENTSFSAVILETNDAARRAIRSILDISMFIRTRQPTGQVFYLGSDPRKANFKGTDVGTSYVSARLKGGELLVKMQFNGTPEAYTVGGNKLDNGYNHLIEVVRNQTLVQVKLNGTEYFRKTLSSTGLLDAQVLYLGGPPPVIIPPVLENSQFATTILPNPAASILPNTGNSLGSGGISANSGIGTTNSEGFGIHSGEHKSTISSEDYFKGIIQDVKVSNGSHNMIVELYPLEEEDLALPPPFGTITIDRTAVLKGEVSDDLCRKKPCQHNAICHNTWNDYTCQCPNGYKGKDCQEIEFCQLIKCPGQSVCQNLDDGYECLTNITFQGNEIVPLKFTYHREHVPIDKTNQIDSDKSNLEPTIEIAYRTRTGGTLLYVGHNDTFFEIGVNQGQVTVTWKILDDSLGDTKRFSKDNSDTSGHEWSRIYLRAQNGKLEGGWKGWESMVVDPSPAFSADIDVEAFRDLLTSGAPIYLGGMPLSSQISTNAPTFVKNTENSNILTTTMMDTVATSTDTSRRQGISSQQGLQFKGCLGEARIGNLLLPYFTKESIYPRTDKIYVRPRKQFQLNSTKPAEGCILCFDTECMNGGHCRSPKEDFACACANGYDGDDCSHDIDECALNQCQNNATCTDKVADFICNCLPGYEGRYCEQDIDECASQPCHNAGKCVNLIAAFECECTEDYAGPQCDTLKQVTCDNKPCHNGSTCVDGFSK